MASISKQLDDAMGMRILRRPEIGQCRICLGRPLARVEQAATDRESPLRCCLLALAAALLATGLAVELLGLLVRVELRLCQVAVESLS